jgi:PhzF family phenazine biosynthesis protein
MNINIYQVDAFTDKIFGGNPAAVCPLDKWLSDEILQNIAMENNLAETVFYVKEDNQFQIRWFTPIVEVDLCGHATLAAAFVLFNLENYRENIIRFFSPRSGELTVSRKGEFLILNFPEDKFEQIELSRELIEAFDIEPKLAFKGKTDYLLIFDNEDDIKKITPSLDKVAKLKSRGVIVTAKGDDVDFVSRFFAPQSGINEDPVTGSAHTTLIPYWADRLGKSEMTAIQLSKRKGFLKCKFLKNRVEISGQGKLYMTGTININ